MVNMCKHELKNPKFKFEGDPIVNKFEIMVLSKQIWVKLEIAQFQHMSIKLYIT